MDIKAVFNTITGNEGDLNVSTEQLIKCMMPDMRPAVSNVILEAADVNGKKFLSASGQVGS